MLISGQSFQLPKSTWRAPYGLLQALRSSVLTFAVLGGLFRMFVPELAQQSVPSASAVLAMQAVLLVIGVLLTFKAYGRDAS